MVPWEGDLEEIKGWNVSHLKDAGNDRRVASVAAMVSRCP